MNARELPQLARHIGELCRPLKHIPHGDYLDARLAEALDGQGSQVRREKGSLNPLVIPYTVFDSVVSELLTLESDLGHGRYEREGKDRRWRHPISADDRELQTYFASLAVCHFESLLRLKRSLDLTVVLVSRLLDKGETEEARERIAGTAYPDLKISSLATEYEAIRLGLLSVGYIATGDTTLLEDIPAHKVPLLIEASLAEHINQGPFNVTYEFNGVDSIPLDCYTALIEFLRNGYKKTIQANLPEEPTPILNDRDKIKIYAREQYSAHVSFRSNGTFAIGVADNGPGIPFSDIPHIFGAYTDFECGAGIGLQVVKRLADLRGAAIDVTSTHNGVAAHYDTHSQQLTPATPSVGTEMRWAA